jgi:hypothetical protein
MLFKKSLSKIDPKTKKKKKAKLKSKKQKKKLKKVIFLIEE